MLCFLCGPDEPKIKLNLLWSAYPHRTDTHLHTQRTHQTTTIQYSPICHCCLHLSYAYWVMKTNIFIWFAYKSNYIANCHYMLPAIISFAFILPTEHAVICLVWCSVAVPTEETRPNKFNRTIVKHCNFAAITSAYAKNSFVFISGTLCPWIGVFF